jgi:hypothetical protein
MEFPLVLYIMHDQEMFYTMTEYDAEVMVLVKPCLESPCTSPPNPR